jgi:hypothetical protein
MAHYGQDHWTEKVQLDKQHARARRKTRGILDKKFRRLNKQTLKLTDDTTRRKPKDPWPHGNTL